MGGMQDDDSGQLDDYGSNDYYTEEGEDMGDESIEEALMRQHMM